VNEKYTKDVAKILIKKFEVKRDSHTFFTTRKFSCEWGHAGSKLAFDWLSGAKIFFLWEEFSAPIMVEAPITKQHPITNQ